MKKLAFVYDAIYPYVKGGGEVRFYELGKRLAKKNFEVHFYGMKYWEGPRIIKKEGMYYHGICKAKRLYTKSGRRSIWQALYFGMSCLKLITEDFDVIDCCGFPYFSLFPIKIVCLVKRKQLFSTWHEVWGRKYWNEYLGRLGFLGFLTENLSVKLPDHIIAVSEQTAEKIKNELHYSKPITIIPNGIDYEHIQKIKPTKETSDVIYAGRLMDFKHIDILIEAIAILKKDKTNITCMIIGDGPEKERLISLTKKLHLDENISFLGFMKNRDSIYSLMKSSTVFVLPSTREGFGIAVLEANSCGIPVITVNTPNNSALGLIKNGTNGIISELEATKLAINIRKMLVSKHKLNKEIIKQFVSDYDWNTNTEKATKVYAL